MHPWQNYPQITPQPAQMFMHPTPQTQFSSVQHYQLRQAHNLFPHLFTTAQSQPQNIPSITSPTFCDSLRRDEFSHLHASHSSDPPPGPSDHSHLLNSRNMPVVSQTRCQHEFESNQHGLQQRSTVSERREFDVVSPLIMDQPPHEVYEKWNPYRFYSNTNAAMQQQLPGEQESYFCDSDACFDLREQLNNNRMKENLSPRESFVAENSSVHRHVQLNEFDEKGRGRLGKRCETVQDNKFVQMFGFEHDREKYHSRRKYKRFVERHDRRKHEKESRKYADYHEANVYKYPRSYSNKRQRGRSPKNAKKSTSPVSDASPSNEISRSRSCDMVNAQDATETGSISTEVKNSQTNITSQNHSKQGRRKRNDTSTHKQSFSPNSTSMETSNEIPDNQNNGVQHENKQNDWEQTVRKKPSIDNSVNAVANPVKLQILPDNLIQSVNNAEQQVRDKTADSSHGDNGGDCVSNYVESKSANAVTYLNKHTYNLNKHTYTHNRTTMDLPRESKIRDKMINLQRSSLSPHTDGCSNHAEETRKAIGNGDDNAWKLRAPGRFSSRHSRKKHRKRKRSCSRGRSRERSFEKKRKKYSGPQNLSSNKKWHKSYARRTPQRKVTESDRKRSYDFNTKYSHSFIVSVPGVGEFATDSQRSVTSTSHGSNEQGESFVVLSDLNSISPVNEPGNKNGSAESLETETGFLIPNERSTETGKCHNTSTCTNNQPDLHIKPNQESFYKNELLNETATSNLRKTKFFNVVEDKKKKQKTEVCDKNVNTNCEKITDSKSEKIVCLGDKKNVCNEQSDSCDDERVRLDGQREVGSCCQENVGFDSNQNKIYHNKNNFSNNDRLIDASSCSTNGSINLNIEANLQHYIKSNLEQNTKANLQHNIKPNLEPNTKPNSQQNIKLNLQHNIKPNLDHNIKPNLEPNTKPNSQQNIKLDLQHNIKPNSQQNIKLDLHHNIKPNLDRNIRPNLEPNTKPNSQQNIKLDLQHNTKPNSQQNIKLNLQHNIKPNLEPNTKPNSQQNIKLNLQHNIKPNLDHNIKPNLEPNTKPNSQQNIKLDLQHNIKPNSQQNIKLDLHHNIKPNLDRNIRPNLEPNTKPNSQQNIKLDLQHNIKPNSQQNIKLDLHHNIKPNLDRNIKPNSQHNIKLNSQHNIKPNSQQNTKPNSQQNTKPNSQQNIKLNSQQNIKPNLEPNTKPNLEHNTKPNLQHLNCIVQSTSSQNEDESISLNTEPSCKIGILRDQIDAITGEQESSTMNSCSSEPKQERSAVQKNENVSNIAKTQRNTTERSSRKDVGERESIDKTDIKQVENFANNTNESYTTQKVIGKTKKQRIKANSRCDKWKEFRNETKQLLVQTSFCEKTSEQLTDETKSIGDEIIDFLYDTNILNCMDKSSGNESAESSDKKNSVRDKLKDFRNETKQLQKKSNFFEKTSEQLTEETKSIGDEMIDFLNDTNILKSMDKSSGNESAESSDKNNSVYDKLKDFRNETKQLQKKSNFFEKTSEQLTDETKSIGDEMIDILNDTNILNCMDKSSGNESAESSDKKNSVCDKLKELRDVTEASGKMKTINKTTKYIGYKQKYSPNGMKDPHVTTKNFGDETKNIDHRTKAHAEKRKHLRDNTKNSGSKTKERTNFYDQPKDTDHKKENFEETIKNIGMNQDAFRNRTENAHDKTGFSGHELKIFKSKDKKISKKQKKRQPKIKTKGVHVKPNDPGDERKKIKDETKNIDKKQGLRDETECLHDDTTSSLAKKNLCDKTKSFKVKTKKRKRLQNMAKDLSGETVDQVDNLDNKTKKNKKKKKKKDRQEERKYLHKKPKGSGEKTKKLNDATNSIDEKQKDFGNEKVDAACLAECSSDTTKGDSKTTNIKDKDIHVPIRDLSEKTSHKAPKATADKEIHEDTKTFRDNNGGIDLEKVPYTAIEVETKGVSCADENRVDKQTQTTNETTESVHENHLNKQTQTTNENTEGVHDVKSKTSQKNGLTSEKNVSLNKVKSSDKDSCGDKSLMLEVFRNDVSNIATAVKLLIRKRPRLNEELTEACKEILTELGVAVKKKVAKYDIT